MQGHPAEGREAPLRPLSLGTLFFVGCSTLVTKAELRDRMRADSVGPTPCTSDEVVIEASRTEFVGLRADSTWVARCYGERYRCASKGTLGATCSKIPAWPLDATGGHHD